MSILIKGMEMPKKGEWISVNIFPDGKCFIQCWCGKNFNFAEQLTAVPVPPHGRLIDADVLDGGLKEMSEIDWNKKAVPENWAVAFDALRQVLEDERTVIPAEQGEEEAT